MNISSGCALTRSEYIVGCKMKSSMPYITSIEYTMMLIVCPIV